jgi:D-alanine-D-alanine ligase
MNPATREPGRIGVLLGGLSSERPISLKSGHAVADALRRRGHEVVEIDVDRTVDRRLRDERVDTAFPVLHGKWGEDGCIQGLLEMMGIPYAGPSVFSAALTMDKTATVRFLGAQGVAVPRGLELRRSLGLEGVPDLPFPWPAVVKPVTQGSSIGVTTWIRDRASLLAAVEKAFELDERVLIEECLEGPELTVAVLQGEVLPVVEIAPKDGWFDFERKYTKGTTEYFVPARIDDGLRVRVQALGQAAARLTGCEDICRVDVMAGGGAGPRVLEVNTIPGFTATSLLPMAAQAVGISFEEVCDRLVRAARLRN